MTTQENINISVTVDIQDGSAISDEIVAALNDLAFAIAGDEIATQVGLDEEVSGFSFGKFDPTGGGPILKPGGSGPFINPGPMGICINKTTGGDDGGHCTVNTDMDTNSCTIDVW